jgi:hypothetical protein
MDFLAPTFLWGGLAVCIPLLLHLLRRQQTTVVPWAAHRFLHAVSTKVRRRTRLRNFILLLIRCLALLLLALLFAQPSKNHKDGYATSGKVLVFVDQSGSMAYRDGQRSRYDLAGLAAEEAVNQMPEETRLALFLYSDKASMLVNDMPPDAQLLARELRKYEPIQQESDITAALSTGLSALKERDFSGDLLILTDAQASAWTRVSEIQKLLAEAKANEVSVRVINVVDADTSANLAVTKIQPLSDRQFVDAVVPVKIEVLNGGDDNSKRVRVQLELSSGVSVAEGWLDPIKPGESAELVLEFTPKTEGYHVLTALIPTDGLSLDDSRSIGIEVRSPIRLGIVESFLSGPERERHGFFVSAAATPYGRVNERGTPIKSRFLQVNQMPSNLADHYDVLVLAGLSNIPTASQPALREFVRDGGGLWVLPSGNPSQALELLNQPIFKAWFPGIRSRAVVQDERTGVTEAPYDHPIVGYWNNETAGTFRSLTADKWLKVEGGLDVDEVLSFKNQSPLLIANEASGRVLFSTVPLNNAWSNFPRHPQFVPLVQRCIDWLSSPVSKEGWNETDLDANAEIPHAGFSVNMPPRESQLKAEAVNEILNRHLGELGKAVDFDVPSKGLLSKAGPDISSATLWLIAGLLFLVPFELMFAGRRPGRT